MEKNTENCTDCCCGPKNCCSSGSLRGSIGRILLGVLLLGGMFVWGMKAGMTGGMGMHGRGGRGDKGGCMMGGMKDGGCPMMKDGGCGMMKDGGMKKDDMMPAQQPTEDPADAVAPATGTTTSGQA